LLVVGLNERVEEAEAAEEEGGGTVAVAAAAIVVFVGGAAAAAAAAVAGVVGQTLRDELGEGLNDLASSTRRRGRCHHRRN